MPNPLFYERQRRRISTWGVPRFLQSFDETLDGGLILPRGLRDTVASLAEQAGSRLEVTDDRATGHAAGVHVHGHPERPSSRKPPTRLTRHDLGVLVAPPGAGKTVIACAVMATHSVSTLVLVDRKTLADQWRARIRDHLGVTPGQLGGGRAKIRGVDRHPHPADPRPTGRHAELSPPGMGWWSPTNATMCPRRRSSTRSSKSRPRRWLGLTATPYRRDKLDDLIAWQVGPVRHTISHPAGGRESATDGWQPNRRTRPPAGGSQFPARTGPACTPDQLLLYRRRRPVGAGRDRRGLPGPGRRRGPHQAGRRRCHRSTAAGAALPGPHQMGCPPRPARRRAPRAAAGIR